MILNSKLNLGSLIIIKNEHKRKELSLDSTFDDMFNLFLERKDGVNKDAKPLWEIIDGENNKENLGPNDILQDSVIMPQAKIEYEKVDYDKIELKYEFPDLDKDKWKGLRDDVYKPSRENYVIKKFKKDFPNIPVNTYTEIMNLVSRSQGLRDWYSTMDLQYVDEVQIPTYYQEYVKPNEYINARVRATLTSDILSKKSEILNALAFEYKNKRDIIEEAANVKIRENMGEDAVTYIATLPSDKMPLSILASIEKYTPKTSEAPTKKAYAREALINYKISLLKLHQSRPKMNMQEFVEKRLFK